jgi:hypothetical protein
MRLIINGYTFELDNKSKISQTKQVNDLLDLSDRQTNYTNAFGLPKTPGNIKKMKMLGVVGNDSNVPYQRNETFLFGNTGECFVYKGWCVINETNDVYKIAVYDGFIDFHKAIENTFLSDLDLAEINHVKNLTNVVASWDVDSPYKYILADYNGKALYDANKINIDYLVPSAKVSYLWDKIFEQYGFTYEGGVFNTFNFQNLWMSFPKGTTSTIADDEMFDSSDITYLPEGGDNKSRYFKYNTYTIDAPLTLFNYKHIIFPESGTYRLEITGDISILTLSTREFSINLSKNQQSNTNSADISSFTTLVTHPTSGSHTIGINQLITIDSDESLCLFIRATASIYFANNNLNVKISKVESSTIDFEGAFLDFKTKSFINEVMWRFGLTPYTDKYSKHIKFLTLQEVLQTSEIVNWSQKNGYFHKLLSEKYIYGSYAQNNIMSYQYNNDLSDYYNGSLKIENVNLDDSKTIIDSQIYAPEKVKTNPFGKETNIYKLWNKEIKDDGNVTYKALDKRFYFMRFDNYTFNDPVTIGSETLSEETIITEAPFESFFKLNFNDIIQDYYNSIYQILNKSKVIIAEIFLNEADVVNIDFKKLYYIEELSNYFILNKVPNFTDNGLVKCELIRVKYSPFIEEDSDSGFIVTISYVEGQIVFSGYDESYPIIFQYSTNNGDSWSNGALFITSNEPIIYPVIIDTLVRFINVSGDIITNTILITA